MTNQETFFGDETQNIEREVNTCIDREYSRTKIKGEQNYIPEIKNRHEGYGHAAEGLSKIELSMKQLKDDMKDFLSKLPGTDDSFVTQVGGDIYGHALTLAVHAVTIAATAKRIIYDIMVDAEHEDLPMEAIVNSTEDDESTTASESDLEFTDAESK